MSRWLWGLGLLALGGCVSEGEAGGDIVGAAKVIEEGTPEATGVLAFLNDKSTTLVVLDVDAALDARAAMNLLAHRDGPDARLGTGDDDLFGTIAEVDAVAQVGDAALRAILAYAQAHGWIPAGDPLYGVVEGVELTVADAADIVRVANAETEDVLDDDVGLDSRAAAGIVATRPFPNVEGVAAVPYVGASALEKLADWGAAHPVVLLDAESAVALLELRTEGLLFLSESDYPLDVWTLAAPSAPITAANAKTALASVYVPRGDTPLAERSVEVWTLDQFFDRYTHEEDWWEDSQREQAPQWKALRDVFETQLTGVQIFRFGRKSGNSPWLVGAIDIFVFGVTSEGKLVGFRTVSVET